MSDNGDVSPLDGELAEMEMDDMEGADDLQEMSGEVEGPVDDTGADDVQSYKEVSEMSEVTQESFPEGYVASQAGAGGIEDLVDFEKLKNQTQQKLKIHESEQDPDEQSIIDTQRQEASDEFIRNLFIKFGMKKTLDSFA